MMVALKNGNIKETNGIVCFREKSIKTGYGKLNLSNIMIKNLCFHVLMMEQLR